MFGSHHGKTFAGVASIPERVTSLKLVIDSIYDQVDKIGVYLNNYESVPSFLLRKKIIIRQSQDHGDLKDNGKFYFLSQAKEQYYATLDDDIIYPSDYVARLIETLQITSHQSAIAVHGVHLPKQINSITAHRYVYHYERSTPFVTRVDILGTGTVLFDQSVWKLQTNEFIDTGMSDVWFALAANKRGYPLFVINRNRGWLSRSPFEKPENDNLYKTAKRNQDMQVGLLQDSALGGSIEKVLNPLVQRRELRAKFSMSHLLQVLYVARTLGWDKSSREFNEQFLTRFDSETSSVNELEKSNLEYLSVVKDILEENISITTLNTFNSWIALAEKNPKPPRLYGMRFDFKPARASKIREELISRICANWSIDAKKPNQTDVDSVLRSANSSQVLQLLELTKDVGLFSPLTRGLEEADPRKKAKLLFRTLGILRSEKPTSTELFQDFLEYSKQESLELSLVACVALLYTGNSPVAAASLDSIVSKHGYSFEILLLRHLIAGYNQATKSEIPLSLMNLVNHHYNSENYASDAINTAINQLGTNPKVSVVMTALNPGDSAYHSLKHLLDSSLMQNIEVICIDDGSDVDFTPQIRNLNDSRVTTVRIDESIGIYDARNRAIEMASGELIAFLDAGDFSTPDRLYLQAGELEKNPNLQAVTSLGIRFDDSGLPSLDNNCRFLGTPPASLMVRREAFGLVGPFLSVPTRGDVEFLNRITAFFGDGSLTCVQRPLYLADSPKNSSRYSPEIIEQFKYATSSWHNMIRDNPASIRPWIKDKALPVPLPEFN